MHVATALVIQHRDRERHRISWETQMQLLELKCRTRMQLLGNSNAELKYSFETQMQLLELVRKFANAAWIA